MNIRVMANKCKYFCMGTPRLKACMNQTMLCGLILSLSNCNFTHSLGISNEYVCERGANLQHTFTLSQ